MDAAQFVLGDAYAQVSKQMERLAADARVLLMALTPPSFISSMMETVAGPRMQLAPMMLKISRCCSKPGGRPSCRSAP